MEYLSRDNIREEFKKFLRKNARYTKLQAEMATVDFPNLIENSYLDEKFIDIVTIDGAEYECRSTWTNFVENYMVDTNGKTFCFYVFYRKEDIPNSIVTEYAAARKLYSISDLKHEDFPWYVVWPKSKKN